MKALEAKAKSKRAGGLSITKKSAMARQQRFVEEYCKDFNATRAFIRTGFSAKTANVEGSKYLSKPSIHEAVEKRKAELLQISRLGLNEYWLGLSRLYHFDIADCFDDKSGVMKPLSEMPDEARWCISELENSSKIMNDGKDAFASSKIKFPTKLSILQEMGRALRITGQEEDPGMKRVTAVIFNINAV